MASEWRSAALVVAAILAMGCGGARGREAVDNAWQYPIHVGDSRSTVHRFLTMPARNTGVLEEYLASGVSILFDPEDKVAKITISGVASRIYSDGLPEIIVSAQPVVFGLSGRSNETEFMRVLGRPESTTSEGAAARRERRHTWKRSGYIITGEFLAAPRTDQANNAYPEGTLLWFDVTRGI